MCTIRQGLDSGIALLEERGIVPRFIRLYKEQWDTLKKEMEHLMIKDNEQHIPQGEQVGTYRGLPVILVEFASSCVMGNDFE